ncbi:hypothetical protein E1B28_007362 [Marasmius oreades]|uniref:ASX DEUBAD domain-containing protein n=1 Tax=Marasmius oreades TaxID=181124 RepID=A0A9P7UTP5_9AGAR|nr:uncharacterized protein E1B28_007362 [Marasmius oreades]KAG7093708.1 hypothetical protein E1B28_007362 [Marasmius oreades]
MASVDRPRRSTRKTTKLIEAMSDEKATTSNNCKRKVTVDSNANFDDGEYELSDLLEYPQSALTTMDISNLINASTWEMLSPEYRAKLAKLLPPTAFKGYSPNISSNHPAYQSSPTVEGSSSSDNPNHDPDPNTVDPNFFNDLHFLAAARTFQDHIYSGWLTEEHKAKVKQWEEDVRDGKVAAPWKDEEWEKNAAVEEAEEAEETSAAGSASKSQTQTNRGMPALEIRLHELARHSVIQVGDILSYKRHFNNLDLTVEKDVLIYSNNTRQRSLTIFLERETTQHLPLNLLLPDPEPDPTGTTQSIEVTSPTMLETAILDLDGRVGKDRRPNGNAWKCFTVWRWREGTEGGGDEKGGRENHGTLFYLRGCIYSDR